jgi:hypothetical protein
MERTRIQVAALSWLAGVGMVATGCSPIRPMTLGQGAELVQPGAAQIGIATGGVYSRDTSPSINTGGTGGGQKVNSSNLFLPMAEGNVQYGLNDRFALNAHASAGNVQPGLKISLVKGPVTVSVMPEFGIGYMHANPNTGSGNPADIWSLALSAKVFASLQGGWYGGLGLGYQNFSTSVTTNNGGMTMSNDVSVDMDNLSLGVGRTVLSDSGVIVRPEVDFLYSFSESYSTTQSGVTASLNGGSGWAVFPNVTIAVGGAPSATAAAAAYAAPPPAAIEPAPKTHKHKK